MDRMRTIECSDLQPWLVDHLQGRSGGMQEKIDRHLASCHECREWVEFVSAVEREGVTVSSGARPGFGKRLENLADYAAANVAPGRFQRRFMIVFVGTAVVGIALAGGLLPTVQASISWLGNLGFDGIAITGLTAAGILLLSSPILIRRVGNRMEGS